MSGKKFFQIDPENRPNQTTRERVVSERGRKELPPGTKGGENLKPDRHYEHKQYAFDSYCKKVLKCEACNGYRQISRRQKRFTSLEELSEAEMAQLAVYDCYPWEYTTFPVGGAVILIEDDGLAEALLGLSQEDREIFMMHWLSRVFDAQYQLTLREEIQIRTYTDEDGDEHEYECLQGGQNLRSGADRQLPGLCHVCGIFRLETGIYAPAERTDPGQY